MHSQISLYPNMFFNYCCQFDRQLLQIGYIQKRIPIYPLDAGLVITNSRRHESDTLSLVFLLDTPQVFLGGGAVIATIHRLAV